jgi:8-amino-7-oxononanoate synthase
MVYAHADPAALEVALRSSPGEAGPPGDRGALAVTESVFSVFGDLAPLARLHEVVRARGGVLLVDDAHGLGVNGPSGAGGVAAAGLGGATDVVITATLSKALGAAGGLVAGPAMFIRHLIETSRTFIYDTGLPPALAAGALAALRLATGSSGDHARAELATRATAACQRLRQHWTVGEPAGGVLSVLAASPEQAVAWAAQCRAHGVAVGCFRPPSTPDGSARLRLTINAAVARAEFDRAIDVIITAGLR